MIQPVKSDLRLRLERAEMSEGVIIAAEGGHYTSAQLNLLVGLKQELQQTILDQLQGSRINDAIARLSDIAHSSSATFPSNHDGVSDSMPVKSSSVRLKLLVPISSKHTDRLPETCRLWLPRMSCLSAVLPRARLHILPSRFRWRLRPHDPDQQPVSSYQILSHYAHHWEHSPLPPFRNDAWHHTLHSSHLLILPLLKLNRKPEYRVH